MPAPNARGAEVLIGAGYVASRDAGNQLGLTLIAFEQIGAIWRRQFEWLVEDQERSIRMLGSTGNLFAVWTDHLSRRAQHVGEGVQQFIEIVQETTDRSSTMHDALWNPFAGVAGLPPLPRTLTRRGVMQRLRTDHQRLERILAKMEELVGKTVPLDGRERDLLASGIDYISEYPDAVHHPLEDRLFAHLLDAPLSAEERRNVEVNAAGHQELIAASSAVKREFESSGSGDLKERIAHYVDLQRRHMTFEERHVFHLADRKLPASALRELDAADGQSLDPVFDDRREHYANLYYYVVGRL